MVYAILRALALSILLVAPVVLQGRGAGDLEEEEAFRDTILQNRIPSGELRIDGEDEAGGASFLQFDDILFEFCVFLLQLGVILLQFSDGSLFD